MGYASNAVGTINDVARISRRCREVGALLSVDAVHIAPHKAIDMDAIGADMLFCSVYKFFGGHIGIAAIRKNVFEALDTYRLHPAPSTAPGKLETGTQSHEAIASIVPAVDFIAGLGTGSTQMCIRDSSGNVHSCSPAGSCSSSPASSRIPSAFPASL